MHYGTSFKKISFPCSIGDKTGTFAIADIPFSASFTRPQVRFLHSSSIEREPSQDRTQPSNDARSAKSA